MKRVTKKLFVSAICIGLFGMNILAQTPSVAAPTPTTTPGPKVISIYSNAYTNIAGTNFTPWWNQTTVVSTVAVAGNATMKYTDFNYQGIELGSEINALAMTHFHIDVWTSNETSMTIAPVSHSANNQGVQLTPLTLNTWNSFDIKLADVADKWLSVSDIFQLFLQGSGGKTVFIDNMYFYNNMAGDDTEDPAGFTVTSGAVTFSTIELLLNATDNSGAVNYEITLGTQKVNLSCASGIQKSYTFNKLAAETQYDFSVKALDFFGNEASNSPFSLSVTTSASPAAAPTPPARTAYKVESIFSGAYASIGGTNFYPAWEQQTIATPVFFDGDEVMMYDNFNYQGIELGADINALPMTHLHVDVYTTNETSFKISPISRSGENSTISMEPLVLNTWNSFDIPLANFTTEWKFVSDIYQFFLEGSGGKTVYMDNLYFYNESAVEDTDVPTLFTATKGVVSFASAELLLKATDNSGAVTFEISYDGNVKTVKGISGVTKSFTIDGLNGNTDYNFSVVAKDPAGNETANSPVVVAVKTLAATLPPIPTQNGANVISIFSDYYDNIAGTNYNPYWSQATSVATVNIMDNTVLSYANLNYQGTEFGSHVDASNMTHLHVDVWTANETSLEVTAISPGKEKLVPLTPLNKGVWNSYDIPLSSFTDVNLSDLFQFKFVGSGGKTVYLDNLYFYNNNAETAIETDQITTVKLYPNPVASILKLNSDEVIGEVEVCNIFGQLVKKAAVNSQYATIDFNSLPQGCYFVMVKQSSGKVVTQKVVKY